MVNLEQYAALFAQFAQGDDFFQSEGASLRDLLTSVTDDVLLRKCEEVEVAWKLGVPLLKQLQDEKMRPFVYVVMHNNGLSITASRYSV